MNTFPEIVPMLQSLRLSGMLASIDVRNRQAVTDQLPPIEFLKLLLTDEVAKREQMKMARRLRRAAFHSTKTVEQFNFQAVSTVQC